VVRSPPPCSQRPPVVLTWPPARSRTGRPAARPMIPTARVNARPSTGRTSRTCPGRTPCRRSRAGAAAGVGGRPVRRRPASVGSILDQAALRVAAAGLGQVPVLAGDDHGAGPEVLRLVRLVPGQDLVALADVGGVVAGLLRVGDIVGDEPGSIIGTLASRMPGVRRRSPWRGGREPHPSQGSPA
jgi:hypothetical protein